MDDIVAKLLDGQALRTFMLPDPSIASNAPSHLEGLDLPHIVVKGSLFWAKSSMTHVTHVRGEPECGIASWCYTNSADIFCSYTFTSHECESESLGIMHKSRYLQHEWRLHDTFSLIWDSAARRDGKLVAQAVRRGLRMKIAMLDSEDVWNIHPVDLPYCYTEDDSFRMLTEIDKYPAIFRQPEGFIEHLRQSGALARLTADREQILLSDAVSHRTFYSVSSDGTCYDAAAIAGTDSTAYKRLKVFAETEFTDIRQ